MDQDIECMLKVPYGINKTVHDGDHFKGGTGLGHILKVISFKNVPDEDEQYCEGIQASQVNDELGEAYLTVFDAPSIFCDSWLDPHQLTELDDRSDVEGYEDNEHEDALDTQIDQRVDILVRSIRVYKKGLKFISRKSNLK